MNTVSATVAHIMVHPVLTWNSLNLSLNRVQRAFAVLNDSDDGPSSLRIIYRDIYTSVFLSSRSKDIIAEVIEPRVNRKLKVSGLKKTMLEQV